MTKIMISIRFNEPVVSRDYKWVWLASMKLHYVRLLKHNRHTRRSRPAMYSYVSVFYAGRLAFRHAKATSSPAPSSANPPRCVVAQSCGLWPTALRRTLHARCGLRGPRPIGYSAGSAPLVRRKNLSWKRTENRKRAMHSDEIYRTFRRPS